MGSGDSPPWVVGPERRHRSRRPGPAVLWILLYAILFAVALWFLRVTPRPGRDAAVSAASGTQDGNAWAAPRTALLSGDDLTPPARDEYLRRLSAECCPCGCDLTVRDCLLSEEKCTKSPELARALLAPLL
jgi:hypothetical protein